MGKTQGFNIASCSFGTLPITGCKRAEIHERSELVRIEGDNDKWPTALAETAGGVEWAVEFTSIQAAEAAQTQMFGSPATLTLTADDATGGTFGMTINIANAVVSRREMALGHKRETSYRVTGEAFSSDGVTNPVSYG